MTDDLITRLAADLKPVGPRPVTLRLTVAGLAGGLVSLVGIMTLLGPRRDLMSALGGPMFWMKLAYVVALGAVAAFGVSRLARPDGDGRGWSRWIAAPLVLMAAFALGQLWAAPPAARLALIMGDSARVCPFLILASATPIFLALVLALRGLAPTHLRLAGATAGLTAGALGAALYALHCGETSGAFVAVWYSLGVFLACAVGALLGPRVLRWR
jgi:hypothetical protein